MCDIIESGYYADTMITTEPETTVEKKVWGPWATIGLGFAVGVVLVISQVITAGIFVAVRFGPTLQDWAELNDKLLSEIGLLTNIATIVSSIVGTGFIIALIKLRKTVSIAGYLGLRPITRKTMFILPAIAIGFLALSYGFNVLINRTSVNETMVNIYDTSILPVLFWIMAVIVAPAFEEIFFRGFLFEGLCQSRLGTIGAIGLTSLGWAILHIQYDIYDMATIFVLGLILGAVRYKTRSLWGSYFIHAFNNLLAAIELALFVNGMAI